MKKEKNIKKAARRKEKLFAGRLPYMPAFLSESTLFLFFQKAIQYRSSFCTRCMTLRVKQVIFFARKQAVANRPCYIFPCPVRNLHLICKFHQVAAHADICSFVVCITVHDCRHLFSGNQLIRCKFNLWISFDNPVIFCPDDSLCIVYVWATSANLLLSAVAGFPCTSP